MNMNAKPPPYRPHAGPYPEIASAPPMEIQTNPVATGHHNYPTTTSPANQPPLALFMYPPNPYPATHTAQLSGVSQHNMQAMPTGLQMTTQQNLSSSSSTPQQHQASTVKPLRCAAGTVEIKMGAAEVMNDSKGWGIHFIEVLDGVLYICPSKQQRNHQTTMSLTDSFISITGKRCIVIENQRDGLIIKTHSQVQAQKWLMVLSQYCFVAPSMEGYGEKTSHRKKIYEHRFFRLGSDGILSWYKSDSEDSDRRGAIQVRGERSDLDPASANTVTIQVGPRTYRFRFETARKTQLWLAAIRWHFGRKPLKRGVRNCAK